MDIPAGLKALTPYERRAGEVERTGDPRAYMIAYFCRYYAMELGLKIATKDKSPEVQNFLLNLMTTLEKEKKLHTDLDNLEGCNAVVRAFAAEKLQQAEEEYFGMIADKNTSRLYYAAATFFEVLATFEEDKILDEATKKSVLYSKWRATEILKAIKEGRQPLPKEGEEQAVDNGSDDAAATEIVSLPPPAPTITPDINVPRNYQNRQAPYSGGNGGGMPPSSQDPDPDDLERRFRQAQNYEDRPAPPRSYNNTPPSRGDEEDDSPPPMRPSSFNNRPQQRDSGYSRPPPQQAPSAPQPPRQHVPASRPSNTSYSSSNTRGGGGGEITATMREDASEYCRFALTSLRTRDDASAIKYLKQALDELGAGY